jgi:CheY-like chemotaxis protein
MRASDAHILIVDDDRINTMLVRRTVERAGLRADHAETGREALDLLRSKRYRLVLLDLQLPDMSGIEVSRTVRDQGSDVLDHDTPLVALSAYADDADLAAVRDAGIDEYLEKPLHGETLRALINRLLDTPHTRNEPRREDQPSGGGRQPAAEEPATDQPPRSFDRSELYERLQSTRLCRTVASRFLASLDESLDAVRRAVARGNHREMRSAAHGLAGAAANVGAAALRELLKSIEEAAAREDIEAARAAASRLDAEAAAARTAIEEFLGEDQ